MSSTINIIIGFDFGTKNIGVAIGQKLTCTAQPLTVLQSKFGVPNWKHIEKIYHEWYPTILIVGLPLQLNGTEQPITILAKKFAAQLKSRFHVVVKMHDERFSTNEARLNWDKYYYRYRNNTDVKKIYHINAIAAEIILKSWLINHS